MKSEILECCLDRFQEHYAPCKIPDDQVSAILSKLLDDTDVCIKSAEGKGVFNAFSKPLESGAARSYRSLESIALAIAKTASEIDGFASKRTLNYFFRCCSRTQLRSDTAGSNHLVDGLFEKCCTCGHEEAHTLSRHSKVVQNHVKSDVIQMRNIASVFEFKTGDNHEKKFDNGKQVTSATVQIMNEDPRRMFSYAFTIERFEMTLWYFCRSHSVMAGHIRLDYPDDFERLVTTFLSFMFATPEEMGYDPTITVHEDGDNTQYTYRIPGDQDRPQGANDRFFRTVATIDDPRSLNITRRSTRVWEVQEMESAEDDAASVKNDGIPIPTCVLKDVWLESAAPTERQIQERIFADIKTFLSKTSESLSNDGLAELSALQQKHVDLLEGDAFKRHFMTIIADYEGRETPAYAKHGTRSITNALEEVRRTSKQSPQSGRQNTSVSRPASAPRLPVLRQYATKRQYRLVFKELCTDVGKLDTLGDVMDVLQEVLIPLQLMHCAGWVHRDISCGNILAYNLNPGGDGPRRWQAKLSDLEYAKQFPPGENDPNAWDKDPKTGTPYFMPHEILLGVYLSAPTVMLTAEEVLAQQNKKQEIMRQLRKANDEQKMKDNTGHGSTQVAVEAPFRVVHNPQHDIESLWWLALWTLTLRVNHDSDSREWASSIFQNTLDPSSQRRDAFNFDIEHNLLKYLHQDLREPFAMAIGNFRALLHFSYRVREQKDLVLELSTYAQAYGYADNFFKEIHADCESARTWRAMKLEQDQADIPKAKRPRSVFNPEVDEASGSGQPNAGPSASESAGQRSSKRPKV